MPRSRQAPNRATCPEDHREFRELLSSIGSSSGHHRWQTFRDFLELAYCATAKPVQPDPTHRDALERRYLDTIGKYPAKDAETFAKLLGTTVLALADRPHDVLGSVYEQEGFCDQRYGAQYWTPWTVAVAMAEMTFDPAPFADNAIVTVGEPACGGGRMLLAFAATAQRRGFDFRRRTWCEAIDLDANCQRMAYIQLAAAGIPGLVRHGNTISGETWETALTPAGLQLLLDHPDFAKRRFQRDAETSADDCEALPAAPPQQLELAL